MADVQFCITGAAFEDGSTLGGLFTVSYGTDGAITAITGHATVTGPGGDTVFSNPYVLSYANPNPSTGTYEITFPTATGGSHAGLYLDWNGQNPSGFNTTSTFPFSSVHAAAGGAAIRLSTGGQANVVRSFSIAGARFEDGSTASGSFTVAYDPATRAIVSIDGSATVTGPSGQTIFTKPYVLPYADPNPATGAYEITFPAASGAGYAGLYLDWNGEDPSGFNSTSTFPYSSVQPAGGNPVRMVDGGSPSDLPCFASGTLIATPLGERPVETLREGDRVMLAGGGTSTVRWVGSRKVTLDGHRRPDTVLPVRIAAGALADKVPMRDLLVSPDHAMLLDGMLIPAKVLVNGATIVQEPRGGSITYVHVMLDAHAPLLANGAPAESYLDIGNHAGFGVRPSDPVALLPAMAQRLREQWSFAPLRERGLRVEAVRARLLARTGEDLSDDPGLRLRLRDGLAVLESRVAVPAEIGACPEDRRRLGVKVAALAVDGVAVPLDHPALRDGWFEPEADGRWTDGAAVVPATLLRGGRITVELAACLRYRAEAATAWASRNGERG